MQPLIILTIVIAVYLFVVFAASRKVVATGTITTSNGNIESKITCSRDNKKALYAMALCYAAKTKWLLLTEQDWVNKTFENVFNETLKNWPQIPYIEMLSSLENRPTVFQIKVYYVGRNWSVNNSLPKKLYAGDLATNYFFLLKAIEKELTNDEKETLGNLLLKMKEDILQMKSTSTPTLNRYNKKISNLLAKIEK